MDKLIVITKPDCAGCGSVKNFLNAKEIEFETIDGYENTDVLVKYGIMSFPVTILLDENGDEIERVIGFNSNALNVLTDDL